MAPGQVSRRSSTLGGLRRRVHLDPCLSPATRRCQGQALADYLHWCITEGQFFCADLNYAPLPAALLPLTFSKIQSMDYQGQQSLSPGKALPVLERHELRTIDNGDDTLTTYYSDGTTEVWSFGG